MSNSQLQLNVQGMKCGGCVATAKDAVSKLPGVETAEFDFKTGTGVVTGNVDPRLVVDALTKVGYPATVKGA